jgi:hypothetical protein
VAVFEVRYWREYGDDGRQDVRFGRRLYSGKGPANAVAGLVARAAAAEYVGEAAVVTRRFSSSADIAQADGRTGSWGFVVCRADSSGVLQSIGIRLVVELLTVTAVSVSFQEVS